MLPLCIGEPLVRLRELRACKPAKARARGKRSCTDSESDTDGEREASDGAQEKGGDGDGMEEGRHDRGRVGIFRVDFILSLKRQACVADLCNRLPFQAHKPLLLHPRPCLVHSLAHPPSETSSIPSSTKTTFQRNYMSRQSSA